MSQSSLPPIYSTFGDDPDLGELVDIFVQGIDDRISSLWRHFANQEWELLARSAHQLKGSAGSYGFDEVTPLAAHLEAALRDAEPTVRVQEALELLVELCRRLRAGTPKAD